jgi:4-hydroxy-tetrahydrodipicolinate synthase
MKIFQGSMVAMATPMQDDGTIDYPSLNNLVDFHLQHNTDAIVPVGTTGESATLNNKEHAEVIKRVVQRVNKRIPVIAGTGANSTDEAIELTEYASKVGADACLLVTPYYNKPTQEGLYQHFKAVAQAVPIPQVLYNVPSRTACDMLPQTVSRLADIENIVGLKEAIGELGRVKEVIDLCGDRIVIISGDDATSMETLLLGGKGVITVTGNIAPQLMHDMCMAGISGERQEAERINSMLKGLHHDLFLESNPIPVKWALNAMGLIPSGIRLPLTTLSNEYHEQLRESMKRAEVI